MANVTIKGREYPLCLTVAGLDALKARGYSLGDISGLLRIEAGSTMDDVAERATWLLSILIHEGEANRAYSESDGAGVVLRQVPDLNALRRMLTPAQAVGMLVPMMQAVSESLHQDIEAAPPKNADQAERA